MTKLPFFAALSDNALREEYRGYRQLAYNMGHIAASGSVNMSKAARMMGRYMRAIEIIEGLARKRKISLA